MPVNLTEESKKLKVDDVNFVDDDIFIIETPKDNKEFVFKQKDGDEEEAKG